MKLTLAKFRVGVGLVLTKSLKLLMPRLTEGSHTSDLTVLGWTCLSHKIYQHHLLFKQNWGIKLILLFQERKINWKNIKYIQLTVKRGATTLSLFPLLYVVQIPFPRSIVICLVQSYITLIPFCLGGRWHMPALKKLVTLVLFDLLIFRFWVLERSNDFCWIRELESDFTLEKYLFVQTRISLGFN